MTKRFAMTNVRTRNALWLIVALLLITSTRTTFAQVDGNVLGQNQTQEQAKTQYQQTPQPDPWEAEMQAFEELDRTEIYPPESILFTGSSSIRLWDTLEEDMAPYSVIQRGFGGSKITDVNRLADRYIAHHTFQAVVLFVANDISGSEEDKTPEEVRDRFDEFIDIIRSYNADAPIFLMAITPTGSRWHVWDRTRAANHYFAALADTHDGVIFIPTEDQFLGEDGLPMDHLFVSDRLHLSPAGYAKWTLRVRSYLEPVLGGWE